MIKTKLTTFTTIIFACIFSAQASYAGCQILSSNNEPAEHQNDPINQILVNSRNCPVDVLMFRQVLKQSGLKLQPTMVANRGFHNPTQGSFSIFEIISGKMKNGFSVKKGDFFFGHFTTVDDKNQLILDQDPSSGSLMIEALAWDTVKDLYNFYELRGNGVQGQWFYRGNSADIYADNQSLYLQKDAAHPKFGSRLRCSACHNSGGPIMKELQEPHNDWWTKKRELDFAGRKPDFALMQIMEDLVAPERLANSVKVGMRQLLGTAHQKSLLLQEQLRPLFCTTEINLESDKVSNTNHTENVVIPSGFIVDTYLYKPTNDIVILRENYNYALKVLHSKFPETSEIDADHAWLTPVKSFADHEMIQRLISDGIINKQFAMAVLSVDALNPIFSKKRCGLLRYVPEVYTPDWQLIFSNNLNNANSENAKQLLENLKDTHLQIKTKKIMQQCQTRLQEKSNVVDFVRLLAQRRKEVKDAEISKNPRGQILEPGFRVIFPDIDRAKKDRAKNLELDDDCRVIAGEY